MLSLESLPRGKVSRPVHGGRDALRKVLSFLSHRRFTGYVKVTPAAGGPGVMAVEGGKITEVRWGGPSGDLTGKEALEAISKASLEADTRLEVHALPHPPKLTPNRPPRPDPAWQDRLAGWKAEGFKVASLQGLLDNPMAETSLRAFASRVERCRRALEALKPMEAGPSAEAVRQLQDRAHDPAEIEAVEVALQALQGGPASAPTGPTPPPAAEAVQGVLHRWTFEAFVAGPSNRLALAAAMTVAKKPGGAYNPLLLVSGPGLGKTHLLHAIANHVSTINPGARVTYVTADTFANEVQEAAHGEGLQTLREKYRSVDLLLLDDLQVLERHPMAREEFLHTFNALHDSGRQVVVAVEKSPTAIPGLGDGLISRLQAGLVVDIQAPDQETKVAILRRKATEVGADLSPTLLQRIAALVRQNVRELEGLLNRVLAHSALLGRPVTEELVREVEVNPTVPPTTTPPAGTRGPLSPVASRTYLVEEERPEAMVSLMLERSKRGPTLLITRTHPDRLREGRAWGNAQMLWLTDRSGQGFIPPSLERIMSTLEGFLEANPEGTIGLDGVEYLVSNNSYDAVLKFLRDLVDLVATGRQVLLLALNPATLEAREVSNLERGMEVWKALGGDSPPW